MVSADVVLCVNVGGGGARVNAVVDVVDRCVVVASCVIDVGVVVVFA